jgi:hypothetical protein
MKEVIAILSPDLFIRDRGGNDEEKEERLAQTIRMQNSLLDMSRTAIDQLTQKIAEADKLTKDFTESSYKWTEGDEETCIKAIQSILPESFRVLPLFKLNEKPENKDEEEENTEDYRDGLRHQLDADFRYDNLTPLQLENWIKEASKVREPMLKLQNVRQIMQVTMIEEGEMAVIQLPFKPDKDREWLGREVSSEDLLDDKESILLMEKDNLRIGDEGWNTGMVFDRWMELIPYRTQEAGLVFNFDQPNAEAPQTVLLSICPRIRTKYDKFGKRPLRIKNWSLNDLIMTLTDTQGMAKNRAIEPDHLYRKAFGSKLFPLLRYDGKMHEYE